MAFDQAERKEQREVQIVYSNPNMSPLSLDPCPRRLMVNKSRNKLFSIKNRFSGFRAHTLFPELCDAQGKCHFLGENTMP